MKTQGALIPAFIILVAFAAACSTPSGSGSDRDETVRDESLGGKATPLTLDDGDVDMALEIARAWLDGGSIPEATEGLEALCGRPVWVSVFRPGAEGVEEAGVGPCAPEAIRDAALRLRKTPAFGRRFEGKMDQARVKVSFLKKRSAVKEGVSLKRLASRMEAGIFGPMLKDNPRMSITPDTIVTHGWGLDPNSRDEKKMRVHGKAMAKLVMDRLMDKAGLDADAWQSMDFEIFSTTSYVEPAAGGGGRGIELYRGVVKLPFSFTEQTLVDAAVAAGDHLLRFLNAEEGRFGYLYYADRDEWDPGYNIVRHAGAVWGLFRLYNVTGEKRFLDGGLAAFAYLEKSFVTPEEDPDIFLIQEGNVAALGTMALAAMATVEMPAEHMTPERKKAQEKLGMAVIRMMAEDGQFYAYYQQVKTGRVPDPQPIYFPGEATLALVNLYEKTKDERWLTAAKKAADRQVEAFNKSGTPDNWEIQVMSRLYRITRDDRYRDAGIRMANYNVEHQYDPARAAEKFKDYYGGFDNARPPRATPAASRTEAMDEAYELAVAAGDAAAEKRFGDAVIWASWFIMNNQFNAANSYFLPAPEKALGGVRGGLTANDIRIDYDQHAIMALLGARAVFKNRPFMDPGNLF